KNVNSIRSVGRAIEYEARRQVDLLEAGERVRQETRHWDENDGRTHTLRTKEDADDYRYFPEPDLVPIQPDEAWQARVRSELPLMPIARRHRLAEAAGVASNSDAVVLAVDRGLDVIAQAAIEAGGDPVRVMVHIEHNLAVDGADRLDPAALAALTRLEVDGKLTSTQAKAVLTELVTTGGDPAAIAKAKGFEAMDTDSLAAVVDKAIADNPDVWAKVMAGNDKAIGAITGAVMKATKGQADGKAVAALLDQRKAQ
ncbi:MAG: gatB, partial [Acidimicrobiia bacterium]|nr:gatB [Acidimicrobiia bacterium]